MTVIEVYADIWCPFAHVGLRCAAERRRKLGRQDVRLFIRAWPLGLVNGVALDPGTTAHHVHDLKTQVAPELFRHFDAGHFPDTTLPALALAHRAFTMSLETGEAVSFALRDALFEEGLDIAQPDVLADIAGRFGIGTVDVDDEQSIVDDWHEGERRGVKGSPHFFCGARDAYCPSLEISRGGAGQLKVNTSLELLDAFLSGCFGM